MSENTNVSSKSPKYPETLSISITLLITSSLRCPVDFQTGLNLLDIKRCIINQLKIQTRSDT